MSGPTEFTLESVRQYMLVQDGRVTNHELVKYFKAWLTHPTEKESARQRFKEYVNTLATIKQENGEKYLVLKKRFYPNFDDDDGPPPPLPPSRHHQPISETPSLLDEVMAGYQTLSHHQQQQQQQARRMLPPTPSYRPPPADLGLPTGHYRPPLPPPADLGLPISPPASYYSPTHSQRSSYASHQRGSYSNGSGSPSSDIVRAPPPYRPPPGSFRQLPPPPPGPRHPTNPGDLGLPLVAPPGSANYGMPTVARSMSNPYAHQQQQPASLSYHINTTPPHAGPTSMMDLAQYGSPTRLYQEPPPLPRRNHDVPPPSSRSSTSSIHGFHEKPRAPPPPPPKAKEATPPPPPLPTRSQNQSFNGSQSSITSRQSSSLEDDKENFEMSTEELSNSALPNSNSKFEEKISVKERTKTFNRMASEVDMHGGGQTSRKASMINRRNSRAAERRAASQARDDKSDSSSISTIDQNLRLWMVKASQGDYHAMMKMLMEDPRLAKHRDFTSGFTALHWAAKHGDLNMVKLLAGNYHVNVNLKSHGGYTPLHLACQFSRQEVFDLLVKAYGADPRIRDNHGKTPRQYMMAQDQSMGLSLSSDTFRQLKDRRRNRRQASEKNPSILRFGSLSVKVKKTTEAFNNYFGSERKHSWHSSDGGNSSAGSSMGRMGSVDSLKMPPPKFAPIKKRRSKRSAAEFGRVKSAPPTPTGRSPFREAGVGGGVGSADESDSEFGFDSAQWVPS